MAVLTPNQVISLNDLSTGITLFQFMPSEYSSLQWTRDQNNPSTCDIAVPPIQGLERLPEIAPWAHWITVWDGDTSRVLWSGPVYKADSARFAGLVLSCKDHAAYLGKTRSPVSLAWDNTDPAFIAAELWQQMIDLQGLKVRPVARADVDGQLYSYTATKDSQKLDQEMNALVEMGLVWTVVSGVPFIGPLPKKPVTTLSDADFTGEDEIHLVRDGSSTFNDVLVRAEGSNTTIAVPYFGQRLQDLKNFDHLSDVSDVTAAATAYVGLVGQVRTRLAMPGGGTLRPDAAVSIDQLIPSARFILESQGVRDLMQLTQVGVQRGAGGNTVKLTMSTALTSAEVQDMEIETASKKNPTASVGSAAASR